MAIGPARSDQTTARGGQADDGDRLSRPCACSHITARPICSIRNGSVVTVKPYSMIGCSDSSNCGIHFRQPLHGRLTDYSPKQNGLILRGYLAGRYGGIPVLPTHLGR